MRVTGILGIAPQVEPGDPLPELHSGYDNYADQDFTDAERRDVMKTRGGTDFVLIAFLAGAGFLFCAWAFFVYQMSKPSHEAIQAPDGKPAILVECSSSGDCLRHASEVCANGYAVLDYREERGTSMLIRCKQ